MVAYLSLKNVWLPTFFFLDSGDSCRDLLFPHSRNLCKNTSVLGGTVLKEKKENSVHQQIKVTRKSQAIN